MITLPPETEMREASERRDVAYDGIFFLAVRTTGIFCRPSCPARKPNPVNVEYFATAEACMGAGYRPCKRCRPLATNGQHPDWVQRLLQEVDAAGGERLSDADLRAMSIDPVQARRYFRKYFGQTFQALQRQRRLGQAVSELKSGGLTLFAGLRCGYSSDSGFRKAFHRAFGRSPGKSRDANCIHVDVIESPLGPLLCVVRDRALVMLEFGNQFDPAVHLQHMEKTFGAAVVPGNNSIVDQLRDQLARYFAGTLCRFTVPIELAGTAFQKQVWARLLKIPYGKTMSYAQLASSIDRPGAQRAVGHANGRNPIVIVVPCHRVINANGKLGGYGGALWRKRFLLDLESKFRSGQHKVVMPAFIGTREHSKL